MADGSIMIETKLSTDKFDKQIAKLDEKVAKKEKEKIEIEAEIKGIQESEVQYELLQKKYNDYNKKLENSKHRLELLKKVQESFKTGAGVTDSMMPDYEASRTIN